MSEETPYWFYNENAPPDLPDCDEIVSAIDFNEPRGWFAYPSKDSPVCWVKHGCSVYWNEVLSQNMANVELAKIGSEVRVPAVYFAFQCERHTVIVTEYIDGQTVEDAWAGAKDDTKRAKIIDGVAGALRALIQIPVGPSRRPSAIDGSRIRHRMFDQFETIAPRHYENVKQLQEHINLVSARVQPLLSQFSELINPLVSSTVDARENQIVGTPMRPLGPAHGLLLLRHTPREFHDRQ